MKIENENMIPRPFCGKTKLSIGCKSVRHYRGYYQTYFVRCNSCHARGGVVSGYTKSYHVGNEPIVSEDELIQKAIAKWNERV